MMKFARANLICPHCYYNNLRFSYISDRHFDDEENTWNEISMFKCPNCEKTFQVHLKAPIVSVNVHNIKEL
jgi:transposase-like protein